MNILYFIAVLVVGSILFFYILLNIKKRKDKELKTHQIMLGSALSSKLASVKKIELSNINLNRSIRILLLKGDKSFD